MITFPVASALSIQAVNLHDDAELDAFLETHFASSMYLRAELRRTVERSHVAIGRLDGRIVAAALQVSSGVVLLQAPVGAAELARAVLRNTGRRLAGFLGPHAQVDAARAGLGLDAVPFAKDTHEDLFMLAISDVLIPPILVEGHAICRVAAERDFALLVDWRSDFRKAVMHEACRDSLLATSRSDIRALLPAGSLFILERDAPLACCSFNARLPHAVNIGNVWTPEHLRGNGYARAVVAGALAIAAAQGVRTAVLATGRHNLAAQVAYRSIGFKLVGDYATAIIAPDAALPAMLSEMQFACTGNAA